MIEFQYLYQKMFRSHFILWIYLALCLLGQGTAEECTDQDEEFLISFHPHLDAFWLNTDDELKSEGFTPAGFLYAMNQRNSKVIFNSMLAALPLIPERKYFVTEIVFFKDWYDYISQAQRDQVKQLIKSGQLQITNGGWTENDEATCYVDDIIDQYTIGHNFCYDEFGQEIKIAWATDSFGHSHSQAAIEHLLGFEIQGIERVDDRFINKRKNGSLLEFYWSAVSDSNGHKYGGVFTHVRHFIHEFVNYRQMNPGSVAQDHERISKTMKKMFRRKKMFRFVGNDFEEFIDKEFVTLEGALKDLNKNGKKCPVFKWGNPTEYFDWIKKEPESKIPVREGDLLPNYDQDHYWTGYYTSNPQLKIVCKDFSRMVNLFRKIYTKYRMKGGAENTSYRALLERVDALLSIMQHHDGIAATSKYHIEQLFKGRMRDATKDIVAAVKKLKAIPQVVCELYNNGNKCQLEVVGNGEHVYLTIVHEGAPKTERIELKLNEKLYEVEQDKNDNIFCTQQKDCTLVFDAVLEAGTNVFVLNQVESSNSDVVVQWTELEGISFTGQDYLVELSKSQISYTLHSGEHIAVSLVRSSNPSTMTQTTTWSKFGDPINKSERRMAGIYIMSNSGNIELLGEAKFDHFKVVQGKTYSKISVSSKVSNIIITINNKELNILNIDATFKPPNTQQFDYFVKVDSALKSNGEFFHDVNGYLVSKRKIGQRLDYEWTYKPEDKINANTYPMCSFGYIIQGEKKLVVFTDRAQGLTVFDNSLLVNIDRLTSDDYKGVGEGYTRMINNTFKFKVGLVEKDSHVERLWQREYDETLIGFFGDKLSEEISRNKGENSKGMLKYTVFSLNKDEFVLRLYNMGEQSSIMIPKFGAKAWNLAEIGFNMKYADITESFANGIPLNERKVWKTIKDEINVFSAAAMDTQQNMILEPLQIRSFRVNLKGPIAVHSLNKPEQALADIEISEVTPLKPLHAFLRRCF